jgi:hypothetical protein
MRKRLENYKYLKERWLDLIREIDRLIEQKENYQPSLLNSVVGGVHGSGNSSPTENAALNSVYFTEQINRKIAEKESEKADIEAELKSLDAFIESIDDVTMKEMINNRYRRNLSWQIVAEEAFYSANSWYYVQQLVYKFLTNFNDIQY